MELLYSGIHRLRLSGSMGICQMIVYFAYQGAFSCQRHRNHVGSGITLAPVRHYISTYRPHASSAARRSSRYSNRL